MNAVRTIASPTYVTDLGVRKSRDPELFYKAHVKIACAADLDSNVIYRSVADAPVESMGPMVDALILFFGDYETVGRAIADRKDSVLQRCDYRALVQAGVVLAAIGNMDAGSFFEAAERCAPDGRSAYAAAHRAAAAYAKRYSCLGQAYAHLAYAKNRYLTDSVQCSPELALWHNLRALLDLRRGCTADAEIEVGMASREANSALEYYSHDDFECSKIRRYLSQIAINQAQLKIKRRDTQNAVRIMIDDVVFLAEKGSDYLAEALGVLSLCQYLACGYFRSIESAVRALDNFRFIGATGAIRSTRNVLRSALKKVGDHAGSSYVDSLMQSDVLGLKSVASVSEGVL